jgi:pimeloyl-ACP methyl ester carboxylesterase
MSEALQPDDDRITALADLATQMWEEVVLDTARSTHTAIADHVFDLVPGSDLPRQLHDGVAGVVYGVLGRATRGTRTVATAVARATARTRDPDLLERSAAWRRTIAILNGVIGDLLEEQGNPLALPMSVRVDDHDVPLDPGALAQAFPTAGGRVAVLLHGLVENDESWDHKVAERQTTYPTVLAEGCVTPVVLRYNTGRHISANASDLDLLLDQLIRTWPVPVTEVILIGHSMGGLVIRGAGELARVRSSAWPSLTRHVVMLGTPHGGAALEKVANAGSWLLAAVPQMAPFSTVLRRRSAGIKDLRHGYLRDEDWADVDPDAWRSERAGHVDGIGEAAHHVVGATLGPTHGHAASHVLGDLMVRWGSATAATHVWAEAATVTHLGSTNHFALLNHPAVVELLQDLVDLVDQ